MYGYRPVRYGTDYGATVECGEGIGISLEHQVISSQVQRSGRKGKGIVRHHDGVRLIERTNGDGIPDHGCDFECGRLDSQVATEFQTNRTEKPDGPTGTRKIAKDVIAGSVSRSPIQILLPDRAQVGECGVSDE